MLRGEEAAQSEDLAAEERLATSLAECASLEIAFSGGVDSSYLLAVALESLGRERVRAWLGVSPSLAQRQHRQALEVARLLRVELLELATEEGDREGYRANLGDRCFWCKDTLFRTIRQQARATGTLCDGTNAEDLRGHRPGKRAAEELGVRSPLAEHGFTKERIRRLSRLRGLPTSDLPSSPCLASRVPAGTEVTPEKLARIEAAESWLHERSFSDCRVRDHGEVARVEVPLEELSRLLQLREECAATLIALGWRFVTVDLLGLRSGSSSLPPAE